MMNVKFWKIEAAGNDFVIIDHRKPLFTEKLADIAIRLADRRLGIGGDGVIFIEEREDIDFFMGYYNADGSGPVMCGNGSRAALYFVFESGICRKERLRFLASDGIHRGLIQDGGISLTIRQPGKIEEIQLESETAYLVDTGVPHLVRFGDKIESLNIYNESPYLRKKYDANINYIEQTRASRWKIRTYERGVEDETLGCGTGATASAITINKVRHDSFPITMSARGGDLTIDFRDELLWLSGPTRKVFEGVVSI
ncbi:MAG TPA: diaminopimelate epimerase [Candidatus Marinimicrobia bacterium]|nr:diaminopimelate epimerase [Candidatus Neomarinimicrobiota bacterium]